MCSDWPAAGHNCGMTHAGQIQSQLTDTNKTQGLCQRMGAIADCRKPRTTRPHRLNVLPSVITASVYLSVCCCLSVFSQLTWRCTIVGQNVPVLPPDAVGHPGVAGTQCLVVWILEDGEYPHCLRHLQTACFVCNSECCFTPTEYCHLLIFFSAESLRDTVYTLYVL